MYKRQVGSRRFGPREIQRGEFNQRIARDNYHSRGNRGQNQGHKFNATFKKRVTPEMVNLKPNQCLLCGDFSHYWNNCQKYPFIKPVPFPCRKHNPGPKYAHPEKFCKGDNIHRMKEDSDVVSDESGLD